MGKLVKIIHKTFIALFLGSVFIHAIIFFDNVIVSRIVGVAYCSNEGLFLNAGDDECSPLSSRLRPTYYFEAMLCRIKGGNFDQVPLHKGYYCLPPPIAPLNPDNYINGNILKTRLNDFGNQAAFIFLYAIESYYNFGFYPLSGILFTLWMLFDCVRQPRPNKGIWIAVILFGYVYGALAYYFFQSRRKLPTPSQIPYALTQAYQGTQQPEAASLPPRNIQHSNYKKYLITAAIILCAGAIGGGGYYFNSQKEESVQVSQPPQMTIPSRIPPSPQLSMSGLSPTLPAITPVPPPGYPGAAFSSSASAFIRSIHDRPLTYQDENQNPPTPTLPDATFKTACEDSGGKWYERKGKDLPMAGCECEYNRWREKNLENVVDMGCDCLMECRGLDSHFTRFNYSQMDGTPKPSMKPSDSGNRYLIFSDELSQCSYLATIHNSCAACVKDENCGEFNGGGSYGWLRYDEKPVCDSGKCKYRRVIYAEMN